MFFNTTPIGATVAAMDGYFWEKYPMGVLHPWPLGEHTDIRYERRYNGISWKATSCGVRLRRVTEPIRFWAAHAGAFTDVLMPELNRIGAENNGRILVEPYTAKKAGAHYWRLEVDPDKERLGVWVFKLGNRPDRSTLLRLKFTVLDVCDFTPGAWVDQ